MSSLVCEMCSDHIDASWFDDQLMWLEDPRDIDIVCQDCNEFLAKVNFWVIKQLRKRGIK